ncbi:hypothetical protein [Streptomyces sp. NRRL F-5123]|uniref:hypothetical protein n=1 Tax=Streptomyces sp. NRRL F-5123 TaxID=1463856 RepID=UPI0004E27413|nr:hypothetical protein [Streptomyces sp. NRRL F-5123]
MTREEALEQLDDIGRAQAFGRHIGSDRLIRAGLDALLAGIDTPSLALLAGLPKREEPEAPALFDAVLDELGLRFHPPAHPVAAQWALATWTAARIFDGSRDPAAGAYDIWGVARELGYPEELQELVICAVNLDDWSDSWDVAHENLCAKAVEAARRYLAGRPVEELREARGC